MASYMFPPSVYRYINDQLGKRMILVLNKIDLVPSTIVLAWKTYFEKKYPAISIVLFTSYPAYNLRGHQENSTGLKIRRCRGSMHMSVEGAQEIFRVCKEIVGSAVDLTSWEVKLKNEIEKIRSGTTKDFIVEEENNDIMNKNEMKNEEIIFDFEEHVKYKNGILTVGCVGYPNVGKSSLMNALMGKKIVSVSRTPGHTKHFQTIFLTPNVRLCDCPGLVFPSKTPRMIQIFFGSYPIAQLREPFVSVKYLAERIDLPKLLNIEHPDGKGHDWSAMDVCAAWAIKRGFLTAKTGRPDYYRAANSILRMALDGKLTLTLRPVGYGDCFKQLLDDPELAKIEILQSLGTYAKSKGWKDDFLTDSETEGIVSEERQNCGVPNPYSDEEETSNDYSALNYSNPFELLKNEND